MILFDVHFHSHECVGWEICDYEELHDDVHYHTKNFFHFGQGIYYPEKFNFEIDSRGLLYMESIYMTHIKINIVQIQFVLIHHKLYSEI